LKAARERRGKTQDEVAKEIQKTRVTIANYERGKAAPDPSRALKLARILGEDPSEFLLHSVVQSVAATATTNAQKAELGNVIAVVKGVLGRGSKAAHEERPVGALSTHLSLLDFPTGFGGPWTIVVGDRREEEPKSAGDLYVFSASPCDDRWLLSLGLPPGTEKISDKVIATADPSWLQDRLGHSHILCIGSPASNLFAREHNHRFLFRFAIRRWTSVHWEEIRRELAELRTPAALLEFQERERPGLRQTMRMFKPPGFVNFNYRFLTLGIDPTNDMDFAVVSLGTNPYARHGERYFCVLAAGVHHPGTAHAVKMLADPAKFVGHPFGGIIEVEVPDRKHNPQDILWHDRVDKSRAYWHTVGAEDLEYTPDRLRQELEELLKKLQTNNLPTDLYITDEEIEDHLGLIELLRRDTAEDPPRAPSQAEHQSANASGDQRGEPGPMERKE
jgi:DNA-binding XRE family transcriptional regulator